MRFELRPYQQDAIAAVISARKRGVRRMVVALPTGAGKTVIFSRLAAMARRKVLVLAHRAELLDPLLGAAGALQRGISCFQRGLAKLQNVLERVW